MAYSITWSEATPVGSATNASTIDTELQDLKKSVRERMNNILSSTTPWETDAQDPKLLDIGAIAGTPKVAHVTDGAAVSIPNITATTIPFVLETLDTNTFHDNATNPSRLTCALAGYYRVYSMLTLVSGINTGVCQMEIRQNGATIAKTFSEHPGGTSSDSFSVEVIALAAATDYFEIRVTQDSGNTWATLNSTISCSFIIEKLDGTT